MTFRVFHNWGTEGWKPVGGDHMTILAAVEAREADIASCGGEVIIVEVLNLYDAYRRAGYEQDQHDRVQQKEAI